MHKNTNNENSENNSAQVATITACQQPESVPNGSYCSFKSKTFQVLLATAPVQVRDIAGKPMTVEHYWTVRSNQTLFLKHALINWV